MTGTFRTCLALVLAGCFALEARAQELYGMRNRGDGGFQVAVINPASGAATGVGTGLAPPISTVSGASAIDSKHHHIFVVATPGGETDSRIYTLKLGDGGVASNPTISGSGSAPVVGLEYDAAEDQLYAMRNPGLGERQLCRINRTTGALTPLGTGTATSTSSVSGVSAIDETGNRFFFIGTPNGETDSRLFTFNTTSGAIDANPVITGSATNPVLAMEYDAAEGVLYALRTPGGGARQLATLNVATGAVTPLGAGSVASVSSASGVNALDPVNNRLFLVGTAGVETDARIYTFDTADGSIDANPPIPGSASLGFSHLQWRYTFPPKGDLNRDHRTDLLVRRNSTNQTDAWLMNGTTRSSLVTVTPTPTADQVIAGVDDFNQNDVNDLAVYRPSTGTVEFWLMGGANGTDRQGAAMALTGGAALASNWKLSATGDFNHDGSPDLVWRNFTSQKIVIWTMNGTAKVGSLIPNPDQAVDFNWEIAAALDFNRDGNRDLLWYNPTSGKIVTWNMDASVVRIDGAFTNPSNAGDGNWRVVAGGDYGIGPDGADAAAPVAASNDLVWRNATSGKYVVWHLNLNRQRTGGLFTTPDSPTPSAIDWIVAGPR